MKSSGTLYESVEGTGDSWHRSMVNRSYKSQSAVTAGKDRQLISRLTGHKQCTVAGAFSIPMSELTGILSRLIARISGSHAIGSIAPLSPTEKPQSVGITISHKEGSERSSDCRNPSYQYHQRLACRFGNQAGWPASNLND